MVDPRYSREPVSRFEGQRGPNGKPLCRECGVETKPPRRAYCSTPCWKSWLERYPSNQRVRVLARDKGVCCVCGLDCLAIEQELNTIGIEIGLGSTDALRRFHARVAELQLPRHRVGFHYVGSLWEMDHIIPVVEGGGNCGLDNLRTLCWRDHQIQTAALASRRAAERKAKR